MHKSLCWLEAHLPSTCVYIQCLLTEQRAAKGQPRGGKGLTRPRYGGRVEAGRSFDERGLHTPFAVGALSQALHQKLYKFN